MKKSKINPSVKSLVKSPVLDTTLEDYGRLVLDISGLLEKARRTSVSAINSVLTSTYWEIGRRIVEFEQGGKQRAKYGDELLVRLGNDLTSRYGRGFSKSNLFQMRAFYLGWEIFQTPSGIFQVRAKLPQQRRNKAPLVLPARVHSQTIPPPSELTAYMMASFPLSWSHYVKLLSVETPQARTFYELEAIRGGWSVRQLDRQISTQFYERSANSAKQGGILKGRPTPPC